MTRQETARRHEVRALIATLRESERMLGSIARGGVTAETRQQAGAVLGQVRAFIDALRCGTLVQASRHDDTRRAS